MTKKSTSDRARRRAAGRRGDRARAALGRGVGRTITGAALASLATVVAGASERRGLIVGLRRSMAWRSTTTLCSPQGSPPANHRRSRPMDEPKPLRNPAKRPLRPLLRPLPPSRGLRPLEGPDPPGPDLRSVPEFENFRARPPASTCSSRTPLFRPRAPYQPPSGTQKSTTMPAASSGNDPHLETRPERRWRCARACSFQPPRSLTKYSVHRTSRLRSLR